MKRAAILFALVLAACGGGNSRPPAAPEPVIEVPAPVPVPQPEQPALEPWQTQPVMPPAGHWLWSVPPDQSPLWQRIEPEQVAP